MRAKTELVFGLVGPIGSPMKEAAEALKASLKKVDYASQEISVSDLINGLFEAKGLSIARPCTSILHEKIQKGNAVRQSFSNNAVLAADCIREIRELRAKTRDGTGTTDDDAESRRATPLESHAFILNQLKRPEEIELLTKTFGNRFIQISVVTPLEMRYQELEQRIRSEQHSWDNTKCASAAREIVDLDLDEKKDPHGQSISKVFHLADVFMDARSEDQLITASDRFIGALFGKTNISPTKDEFGSYMAKAASLRSVDLSRQVGAVIASPEGDVISMGCNEVPRPGGGNYWDEDTAKRRDVDIGGEANKREVNRIVFDFLNVLQERGLLDASESAAKILDNAEHKTAIKKSLVGGITEYGRMVHAEMNAISDAARLGRAVAGATIYVTTYPCHNCAKHLIASGLQRIVFIEPYPKSKTETLFHNIVEPDSPVSEMVSIEHFYGIAPKRYRDIFEKSERQSDAGDVNKWYRGTCAPMLGTSPLVSTEQELHAINDNLYT